MTDIERMARKAALDIMVWCHQEYKSREDDYFPTHRVMRAMEDQQKIDIEKISQWLDNMLLDLSFKIKSEPEKEDRISFRLCSKGAFIELIKQVMAG